MPTNCNSHSYESLLLLQKWLAIYLILKHMSEILRQFVVYQNETKTEERTQEEMTRKSM